MKTIVVLGGIIGIIVIVASVLSSASDRGEPEGEITGVTGPLEVGKVSRSLHTVNVWHEPRHSFGRKDRTELLAGRLDPGDVFVVQKHKMAGGNLWVQISGLDRLELEGWVHSPADDPFRAAEVEGR
jgi:hypothetical protein